MALRGGERALGLRGVLAAPEGRAVLSGQAEDTFQTKVPGVRAVTECTATVNPGELIQGAPLCTGLGAARAELSSIRSKGHGPQSRS